MEPLRGLLQNFFNYHEQYLNNIQRHNTWLAFNCWAIREHYTFLPPRGEKTKNFLQGLDDMGLSIYKLPTSEKPKRIILSDLILDNLESDNPIDNIIKTLEENTVIIKNSDMEEYLESLKIMDQLAGTNDISKRIFVRIAYINRDHKFKTGEMGQIIFPIFQHYDSNLKHSWTSILGNEMSLSIIRYFDANPLFNAKNKSEVAKILRQIKLQEQDDTKRTPLFIDRNSPNTTLNDIYVSKETLDKLQARGALHKGGEIVYTNNLRKIIYRLFNEYRIQENTNESISGNVIEMNYIIKVPFIDLYNFVINTMKAM